MHAAGARLRGIGGENFVQQFRIPGGREPDRRGIRRALVGDVAVQAFVMKHHGNAKPRVLLHPLLHRVGELRLFARAVGDFARTRHLADTVLQQDGCVVGKERALVIDEARLGSLHECRVLPDAFHLRDFFFERHARKKIGEAFFDGQLRIAVGGNILRLAAQKDWRANEERRRRGES